MPPPWNQACTRRTAHWLYSQNPTQDECQSCWEPRHRPGGHLWWCNLLGWARPALQALVCLYGCLASRSVCCGSQYIHDCGAAAGRVDVCQLRQHGTQLECTACPLCLQDCTRARCLVRTATSSGLVFEELSRICVALTARLCCFGVLLRLCGLHCLDMASCC